MLNVHGVNLFKSSVLGLNHEEEDNQHQGRTASSKDETVEVVDLVGDESSTKSHNR